MEPNCCPFCAKVLSDELVIRMFKRWAAGQRVTKSGGTNGGRPPMQMYKGTRGTYSSSRIEQCEPKEVAELQIQTVERSIADKWEKAIQRNLDRFAKEPAQDKQVRELTYEPME
jgi:hypothetical protein